MQSFNGIYENGVVRFPGPVDIPEGAKATVAVIDASPPQPPLGCDSPELDEILSQVTTRRNRPRRAPQRTPTVGHSHSASSQWYNEISHPRPGNQIMETIRGIVDHDVIRLVTPLALPTGSEIEFEPRVVQDKPKSPPIGSNSPELYALFDQRFNSGDLFGAARHNEHQP